MSRNKERAMRDAMWIRRMPAARRQPQQAAPSLARVAVLASPYRLEVDGVPAQGLSSGNGPRYG